MAQEAGALLGHFQVMERDVGYGVLAVVRVLVALATSQPMVGGPLNIFRIAPDGAHRLDDNEIEEVRGHMRRCRTPNRRRSTRSSTAILEPQLRVALSGSQGGS